MHLSDEQLNEYLDQALTAEARAAAVAHLAACADCSARLTALQGLFAAIESLPEQALSRDLGGSVVHALRHSFQSQRGEGLPRWIRLTAGLQAALAVIVLVSAAPILQEVISPILTAYKWPSLAELLLQFQTQWTAWTQSIAAFTPPALPALSVDISTLALTSVAISAFLLWVVGNGLLLRRMTKSS
ncbi:MAG TPA: zf-HC2 domain-containing protein [Anaerolineales bacterium]|jgi:anti-sigma factor RsiW